MTKLVGSSLTLGVVVTALVATGTAAPWVLWPVWGAVVVSIVCVGIIKAVARHV
jgi:hypothetical protein